MERKARRRGPNSETSTASAPGGGSNELQGNRLDEINETVQLQIVDRTGFRFIFKEILAEIFAYDVLPVNPYPAIIQRLKLLEFGHTVFSPLMPDPTAGAKNRTKIGERDKVMHCNGTLKVCSAKMTSVWGLEMIVGLTDQRFLAALSRILSPLFEFQKVVVSHEIKIHEVTSMVGPSVFAGSFTRLGDAIRIIREVVIEAPRFEKALKIFPTHLINLAKKFQKNQDGLFVDIEFEGGSQWTLQAMQKSNKRFRHAVRMAVLSGKAITLRGMWKIPSVDDYYCDNAGVGQKMPHSDALWYILDVSSSTGEVKGPFSSQEIEDSIITNDIRLTSLVWKEGLKDWTPLQNVKYFKNFLRQKTVTMQAKEEDEDRVYMNFPGPVLSLEVTEELEGEVELDVNYGIDNTRVWISGGVKAHFLVRWFELIKSSLSAEKVEPATEDSKDLSAVFSGKGDPSSAVNITAQVVSSLSSKGMESGKTSLAGGDSFSRGGGDDNDEDAKQSFPTRNGAESGVRGDPVPDVDVNRHLPEDLRQYGLPRASQLPHSMGMIVPVNVTINLHYHLSNWGGGKANMRHLYKDDLWRGLLTGVFFSKRDLVEYAKIYFDTAPFTETNVEQVRKFAENELRLSPLNTCLYSGANWVLNAGVLDVWKQALSEKRGKKKKGAKSVPEREKEESKRREDGAAAILSKIRVERDFVDTAAWTLLQHNGMASQAITVFSSAVHILPSPENEAKTRIGAILADVFALNSSVLGQAQAVLSRINTYLKLVALAEKRLEEKDEDGGSTDAKLSKMIEFFHTEFAKNVHGLEAQVVSRLRFADLEGVRGKMRGVLRKIASNVHGKRGPSSHRHDGKSRIDSSTTLISESTRHKKLFEELQSHLRVTGLSTIRHAAIYFLTLFSRMGETASPDFAEFLRIKFREDGIRLRTARSSPEDAKKDSGETIEHSMIKYLLECEVDTFMGEALSTLDHTEKSENFISTIVSKASVYHARFENWVKSDAFVRLQMQASPIATISSITNQELFSIPLVSSASGASTARDKKIYSETDGRNGFSIDGKRHAGGSDEEEPPKFVLYGHWMTLAMNRSEPAGRLLHALLNFGSKSFPLRVQSTTVQSVSLCDDAFLLGTFYAALPRFVVQKTFYASPKPQSMLAQQARSGNAIYDYAKQVVLFLEWMMQGSDMIAYHLRIGGARSEGANQGAGEKARREDARMNANAGANPTPKKEFYGDDLVDEFSKISQAIPFGEWLRSSNTSAFFNSSRNRAGSRRASTVAGVAIRPAQARGALREILEAVTYCAKTNEPIVLEGIFCHHDQNGDLIEYWPLTVNVDFFPTDRRMAAAFRERQEPLRYEGLLPHISHAEIMWCHLGSDSIEKRRRYRSSLKEHVLMLEKTSQYLPMYATLLKYYLHREDMLSPVVPDIGRMQNSLAGQIGSFCHLLAALIGLASNFTRFNNVRRVWNGSILLRLYARFRKEAFKLIIENEKCTALEGLKPFWHRALSDIDVQVKTARFFNSASVGILKAMKDSLDPAAELSCKIFHENCTHVGESLEDIRIETT